MSRNTADTIRHAAISALHALVPLERWTRGDVDDLPETYPSVL
jgi:hypothetical protein